MLKPAVVDGAILKCPAGSSPSRLNVTTDPFTRIERRLVATVLDNQPGLNVEPFGVCAILQGPCVPVTAAAPWEYGAPDILLASPFPLLSADSELQCAVGGLIQIAHPGQSTVRVNTAKAAAKAAHHDTKAKRKKRRKKKDDDEELFSDEELMLLRYPLLAPPHLRDRWSELMCRRGLSTRGYPVPDGPRPNVHEAEPGPTLEERLRQHEEAARQRERFDDRMVNPIYGKDLGKEGYEDALRDVLVTLTEQLRQVGETAADRKNAERLRRQIREARDMLDRRGHSSGPRPGRGARK